MLLQQYIPNVTYRTNYIFHYKIKPNTYIKNKTMNTKLLN